MHGTQKLDSFDKITQLAILLVNGPSPRADKAYDQ